MIVTLQVLHSLHDEMCAPTPFFCVVGMTVVGHITVAMHGAVEAVGPPVASKTLGYIACGVVIVSKPIG